jgi:dTDP-4-amino-4,6-dideoxygalactose transaminase
MGIHQLKKALPFHTKRAAMAETYDKAFAKLPVVTPPKAPAGDKHAWHLYVMQLDGVKREQRDDFIQKMSTDFKVGCSVHFIPMHLHPYWRDRYKLRPEQFPNATKVFDRAVSLPLYTKMSDDQVQRVIAAVTKILTH